MSSERAPETPDGKYAGATSEWNVVLSVESRNSWRFHVHPRSPFEEKRSLVSTKDSPPSLCVESLTLLACSLFFSPSGNTLFSPNSSVSRLPRPPPTTKPRREHQHPDSFLLLGQQKAPQHTPSLPPSFITMRRLLTATQGYAWGKRGRESRVSQLKMSEGEGFECDEEKTYAELWMGTHPNGPSRVMPEPGDFVEGAEEGHAGIFLIELLETHPHYLGDLQEQGDLPFMFKVLSINKALSIQAHPDKKLAERLYATRPDLYKDDNHKPEMAVALSDFEGLCGFRPFEEIVFNLHRYPELRGLVSLSAMRAMCSLPEDPEDRRDALRKLFHSYITAKPEVVATQVNALVQRLGERADEGGFSSDGSLDHTDHEEIDMEDIYGEDYEHREKGELLLGRLRTEDHYVQDLMRRLSKEYPGDIGIMMPLLLNYLRMGEGESFFMAANEPHAYLKGDIMEVMARSDNVVRVALTPKHRDVPLLCEILTYNMGAPPIVTPIQVDQCCHRFTPPIKDFELDDMRVPEGGEYTPLAIPVPSICMVLEGGGQATDGVRQTELRPGVVVFVAARSVVTFRPTAGSSLRVIRTHTNLNMDSNGVYVGAAPQPALSAAPAAAAGGTGAPFA